MSNDILINMPDTVKMVDPAREAYEQLARLENFNDADMSVILPADDTRNLDLLQSLQGCTIEALPDGSRKVTLVAAPEASATADSSQPGTKSVPEAESKFARKRRTRRNTRRR